MGKLRWVRGIAAGALGMAFATAGLVGCELAATVDRNLIADDPDSGPDGAGPDGATNGDATVMTGDDSGDATMMMADAGDATLNGDATMMIDAQGTSDTGTDAGVDTGTDAADAGADAADAADADDGAGDASDADDGSAAADDGGGGDAALLDSGDDGAPLEGGACTALPNTATVISQMDVATDRPAGTGGTLVDGIYYKTSDTIYTGAGGNAGMTGFTVMETLSVANSASGLASLDSIQSPTGMPDITERLTLQPLGGGAAVLTFLCPDYGPGNVEYSVRVGATTELDISIGTDRIETFTLQ